MKTFAFAKNSGTQTLPSLSQPASAHAWRGLPVAISSLLSRPTVQAKLKIGAPGDRFEQEADRVADYVMRRPDGLGLSPQVSETAGSLCQRQTNEPLDEESMSASDLLSMKEKPGAAHTATPAVAANVERMAGGGAPLDHSTRASMESRFGRDFGSVRLHHDTQAAATAEAIGARAFTFHQHIAFAPGEYQPSTPKGQHLLAHELTHVLQQTGTSGVIQRTCACTDGRRATASEDTFLRSQLPRLVTDDYCIIGPESGTYNCIAWTICDETQWIWNQVDSVYGDNDGTVSISDFDAFYQATQNLTPTTSPNSNTLVALFANGSRPTHAAVISTSQPDCGQVPFTSKLGRAWVISHDLYQLEGGTVYGNIVRYYE
jgi:hypothetical protein